MRLLCKSTVLPKGSTKSYPKKLKRYRVQKSKYHKTKRPKNHEIWLTRIHKSDSKGDKKVEFLLTSGLFILFCWKSNIKKFGNKKLLPSFSSTEKKMHPFLWPFLYYQKTWQHHQSRSKTWGKNWSTNSVPTMGHKKALIENTIKSVLTRSRVDVTLESIKG